MLTYPGFPSFVSNAPGILNAMFTGIVCMTEGLGDLFKK